MATGMPIDLKSKWWRQAGLQGQQQFKTGRHSQLRRKVAFNFCS
jgi:hypothetical protein